jgi:hypothetical protein
MSSRARTIGLLALLPYLPDLGKASGRPDEALLRQAILS